MGIKNIATWIDGQYPYYFIYLENGDVLEASTFGELEETIDELEGV